MTANIEIHGASVLEREGIKWDDTMRCEENVECTVEAMTGMIWTRQGEEPCNQKSFGGKCGREETSWKTEEDLETMCEGRHEKDDHQGERSTVSRIGKDSSHPTHDEK